MRQTAGWTTYLRRYQKQEISETRSLLVEDVKFVSFLTFAIFSSPFGQKLFSFYLTGLFTALSVALDHETRSVFCQTCFWNHHNKRITILIYDYLSLSLAFYQHYWYFSMLHWFSHHFYIKHVKNRESHSILKLPVNKF